MTKAIRIHEYGGPEVLTYEDVETPSPGRGEVLLKQTAIGLNYIDIYYRTGLYSAPGGLPLVPGGEGAGVVEAVGEGLLVTVVVRRWTAGQTTRRPQILFEIAQRQPLPNRVGRVHLAAWVQRGYSPLDQARRQGNVSGNHQVASGRLFNEIVIRRVETGADLHRCDERRGWGGQALVGHQRHSDPQPLRGAKDNDFHRGWAGVGVDPDVHLQVNLYRKVGGQRRFFQASARSVKIHIAAIIAGPAFQRPLAKIQSDFFADFFF